MTEEKKSRAKYWIGFVISLTAFITMLIVKPELFWVTIPFVGTFAALAMDVI